MKNSCKKDGCKYKIIYIENGDSFLTKPNKTIHMVKKIIKKLIDLKKNKNRKKGLISLNFYMLVYSFLNINHPSLK